MKTLVEFIKESQMINEVDYRTAARAYKANQQVYRDHKSGKVRKVRPDGLEESNWERLIRSDKLRTETLTAVIREELPNLEFDLYRGHGNGKGALHFKFQNVEDISKLESEHAVIRLKGISKFNDGNEYDSYLDLEWNGHFADWTFGEYRVYKTGNAKSISHDLEIAANSQNDYDKLRSLLAHYWLACEDADTQLNAEEFEEWHKKNRQQLKAIDWK